MAVDQASCTAPDYTGCIVARRAMRFLPSTAPEAARSATINLNDRLHAKHLRAGDGAVTPIGQRGARRVRHWTIGSRATCGRSACSIRGAALKMRSATIIALPTMVDQTFVQQALPRMREFLAAVTKAS